MTGTTGSLLTPRLLSSTTDLCPGLGRRRAGTSGSKLGSDHLVHDGLVDTSAEQILGEVLLAG